MKSGMGHIQEQVKIKKGLYWIDKGIAPLVKFTNGFPGVETIWSCEGSKGWSPYVSFECNNPISSRKIMNLLKGFSLLYKVDGVRFEYIHRFEHDKERISCDYSFPTKIAMKKFTKYVRTINES